MYLTKDVRIKIQSKLMIFHRKVNYLMLTLITIILFIIPGPEYVCKHKLLILPRMKLHVVHSNVGTGSIIEI